MCIIESVNALFYITDVTDRKTILGFRLCMQLGLIVVKCDDDCQCKNLTVAQTNATSPIQKLNASTSSAAGFGD